MNKLIFALAIVFLFASCKKETPQKQLTVNVTPDIGGSVTPSSGMYAMGSTVKLTATPSSEYIFKEWTGGVTGTTNPTNVLLDADKTVTAVFEKREYPLSLTIVGSGTVKEEVIKIAATATNYKSGTTVRLTPQPSAGFQFKKWSGDDTTAKSPLDLVISKPINLTCTFEKMAITSLKIENSIDTIIISKKHKYIVKGVYTDGTSIDLSDSVKINSETSNINILSDGNIIGKNAGKAIIKFTYKDVVINDTINIIDFEIIPVDSRLKSTGKGVINVPVVIINYLPTMDGVYLDRWKTHNANVVYDDIHKMILTRAKDKILNDKIIEKNAIEESSRFRDYGTNVVRPYINIDVVAYINVYDIKMVKVGTRMIDTTRDDTNDNINNPVSIDWYNIDFNDLLTKVNLKNYVNSFGVKEVWFTSYSREVGVNSYNVFETSMSPAIALSDPSNISNGGLNNTDLPRYNNTYVVYGFNGWRGVDTDLHNRGHQLERQLDYLSSLDRSNMYYGNYAKNRNTIGGLTHTPVNTNTQYDYNNTTTVLSDISTWKPSGGSGVSTNNLTWLNKTYSFSNQMVSLSPFASGTVDWNKNAEVKWFIYWWQSIPGYQNIIPHNNTILENWWDLFYNWDEAIKSKKKLYK
jgi:hypothetical protein